MGTSMVCYHYHSLSVIDRVQKDQLKLDPLALDFIYPLDKWLYDTGRGSILSNTEMQELCVLLYDIHG